MVTDVCYEPVECLNIPKILFEDERYAKLSTDAKLLYALLLDRKDMAKLNGWIDEDGETYVVYPKSEMKEHLNASRYRVDLALEELTVCEQMVMVTQPNPGKPCQIYVKDITEKINDTDEKTEEEKMSKMKKDEARKDMLAAVPCMKVPTDQGMIFMVDADDLEQALKAAGILDERTAAEVKKMSYGSDKDCRKAEERATSLKKMASGFGTEIGDAIADITPDLKEADNITELFEYLAYLEMKREYESLTAVFTALGYLFGINEEYIRVTEACEEKGWYLDNLLGTVIETVTERMKTDEE